MGPAAPQPRMPTTMACAGETASQTNIIKCILWIHGNAAALSHSA